jgi:hypothetical protein
MNSRQSGRRRRGGGNAPRPMGQAMSGQGGNRLEVRVRGNAHQLLEKYKQLARDAHQAGDRVAAEYYLQHADHYFRVLNDSRIRQEEMRARRGIFDPLDDETDDDDAIERGEARNGDEGPGRNEQADDGRDGHQRDERQLDDRLRDDRQLDDRQREEGRDETRSQRRERPARRFDRRDSRDRHDAPDAEMAPALSDGEAALVAFGGAPQSADDAARGSADGEPPLAEAPRPRRRPRRTEPAPVEG